MACFHLFGLKHRAILTCYDPFHGRRNTWLYFCQYPFLTALSVSAPSLLLLVLEQHSFNLCPNFLQFVHFPLNLPNTTSAWLVSNLSATWLLSWAYFRLNLVHMSWIVNGLLVLPNHSSNLLTCTLYSGGRPLRTCTIKSSSNMSDLISLSWAQIDSKSDI